MKATWSSKSRSKLFPIARQTAVGAPPGTLIAPRHARATTIEMMVYDENQVEEFSNVDLETIRSQRGRQGVTWINVVGLGDTEILESIAEVFGLHHLALEDVFNLHQRPKVEEFSDHLFVVLRMISEPGVVATEQVSIFFGRDYVLSIQERPGDCFDPVRDRVRLGRGIVRKKGADYLCYALIDAVVDAFFPALEFLGEGLESLEESIINDVRPVSITSMHDMRRDFITVRRALWPYREMLNTLVRDDRDLIARDTQIYLRDSYDHTIQLMDIVETYREIVAGLVDVYLSSVNTRLNETMKVLTMIATIFMPLGFVASLYGMNFDRSVSIWNMPELGWRFGYPFALGVMLTCVAGLVFYFWRKGWIARRRR